MSRKEFVTVLRLQVCNYNGGIMSTPSKINVNVDAAMQQTYKLFAGKTVLCVF